MNFSITNFFKNIWESKIKALSVIVISIACACYMHFSQHDLYTACMDISMVQNYSCNSNTIQWIKSNEVLGPFEDSEIGVENDALQKSLVGKKIVLQPIMDGVRVRYDGISPEEAINVLEILQYHVMKYAEIKNNNIKAVCKEYNLQVDSNNQLMNGVYLSAHTPVITGKIARPPLSMALLQGMVVGIVVTLLLSCVDYIRKIKSNKNRCDIGE